MSTNYYAFGPFPGGDAEEGLHIGQAAAGWRFLFRAHPELGLTTADAWDAFLRQPDVTIRSEAGYKLAAGEMIERMLDASDRADGEPRARFGARTGDRLRDGEHIDPAGHAFYTGDFC